MMESKEEMSAASADSIHMQHLQNAVSKTTNKCISSFKFSLLKQQFEPIYKKDPKRLKKLHEEATAQLETNIKEEVAAMFVEEKIQDFMVKLDEMKTQADEMDKDLVAWRPSGNPSEDVQAHLYPVYRQHLLQLQKVFDQLQTQNKLLKRNLKNEEDKLTQSRSAIVDHVKTWRKASCLTAENREELEEFVKKL